MTIGEEEEEGKREEKRGKLKEKIGSNRGAGGL